MVTVTKFLGESHVIRPAGIFQGIISVGFFNGTFQNKTLLLHYNIEIMRVYKKRLVRKSKCMCTYQVTWIKIEYPHFINIFHESYKQKFNIFNIDEILYVITDFRKRGKYSRQYVAISFLTSVTF